ncbi:MAG TPA: phosphatidate cytidylyltransferase [Vicinamibacterales bacterium]|nr:phosphatidate cytidylyltransferase [Vicinamibacterales bacterium]
MTRILSAVVIAALLLATIWLLPPWATVALAIAGAVLAAGEVAGLASHLTSPVGSSGVAVPASFVGVAAGLVTFSIAVGPPLAGAASGETFVAVALALVVAAGVLTVALGPPSPAAFTRAATMIFAPLYVGLPLGALVWIHAHHGAGPTTWLIAVIAVSDSAQFYSGRAFGRRKLAPAVSPAKTVEGAIGGLIVVAVAGALLGMALLPAVHPLVAAALAELLALFGIAGDLFESLLKRSAGVKDSSHLIPGHGGVLDRIDSHLFAAPIFYLFLRYVA